MLKLGRQVTVLDDLSTGSLDNVAHLRGNPDFECVIGSAADEHLVAGLIRKCDVIVHLAAAVGVRLVLERPVHTIENNLFATGVVLAAAAEEIAAGNPKLVLIASTSEVYGKNVKAPFQEDDDVTLGATVNARWAYACSKAMDEWLGLAYWHEKQVPVIVARFFNTVGARQTGRYGMVLPTFTDQALAGEPITVFGSGNQSRCFCHVSDTVEAVVRLLDTPEAVGQVFNVGSSREIRIHDLAVAVRDAVGSESPIVFLPYEDAYAVGFEDMARRVPDASKLERYTGFKPAITLEQTIADVIIDRRARLATA
jgi:UDP-glucose 4-epimerase